MRAPAAPPFQKKLASVSFKNATVSWNGLRRYILVFVLGTSYHDYIVAEVDKCYKEHVAETPSNDV